jgi:hypothetical protein
MSFQPTSQEIIQSVKMFSMFNLPLWATSTTNVRPLPKSGAGCYSFVFFKMPLLLSPSSYRRIRSQEPVATLISTGATIVLAAITLTKPEKSAAFDKGAVFTIRLFCFHVICHETIKKRRLDGLFLEL